METMQAIDDGKGERSSRLPCCLPTQQQHKSASSSVFKRGSSLSGSGSNWHSRLAAGMHWLCGCLDGGGDSSSDSRLVMDLLL